MKKLIIPAALALLATSTAVLATEGGQLDAYVTKSGVDFGTADDDGTGLGVKGWFNFGGPFAHFEYQTASLDNFNADLESLRLGGGYSHHVSPTFHVLGKAEFVDFGSDIDLDGFGIHGGIILSPAPAISLIGTLGYLALSSTNTDVDGLELNLGFGYHFTKEWGAFVDYRTWMGSADTGGDVDIDGLRAGGTFRWGVKH